MKFLHIATLLGYLLPSVVLANATISFILPSGVEVTIVESVFQKEKFDIKGCSIGSSVCRINGHIPFGVTFGFPNTYLKNITASYQGHSYTLDVADMYNAWGNRSLEHPGVIRYFGGRCYDKSNCQFRGIFSDAAGSFVAEWLIVDGLAIRTVLTSSNDVVNLFKKNIDPPEFD